MKRSFLVGGLVSLLLLCSCGVNASEEVAVDASVAEESSPFILWEYEGYVDECRGYTWQDEFKDCDYDGDGVQDRVSRKWYSGEQTAEYTIEFGNGKTLEVPKGWETGFPHVQGGDLDGDGENEILFTLSYDTSTDPESFGDIWLFTKATTLGEYYEVELPFDAGENGAKGFFIDYSEPRYNYVHYSAFNARIMNFGGAVILDDDYLNNFWTNEEKSELRSIYHAEMIEGNDPLIRCYMTLFPKYGVSLRFDLRYINGACSIGNLCKGYPGDEAENEAPVQEIDLNDEGLPAGTFTLGDNDQVVISPAEVGSNDEGSNSKLFYTEGGDLSYELTDDVSIHLFAPYEGTGGEYVSKEVFLLYLKDFGIDCYYHVNDEGKIDYISGIYYA